MSDSQGTSYTKAASRTYRKRFLEQASIFVNRLPQERVPLHIDTLKRSLSDLSPLTPALIGVGQFL